MTTTVSKEFLMLWTNLCDFGQDFTPKTFFKHHVPKACFIQIIFSLWTNFSSDVPVWQRHFIPIYFVIVNAEVRFSRLLELAQNFH